MARIEGTAPVEVVPAEGGCVWRVRFGGRRGNVLDGGMVAALAEVFERAQEQRPLKAIVLEGRGEHFSYGTSVSEHLPEHAEAMLKGFHGLIRAVLGSSVFTAAAVRGACLGGGLELATACHRIHASKDARLGQPEIALGVFPPVAALLLPERIGRPAAEDLCLSGRSVDADEALALGLVDDLVDDPAASALAYVGAHLLQHSASSLRFAIRALRTGLMARFAEEIGGLERLYLDELMKTADAAEGCRAFLEKRKPDWSDG